jgi:DNA repair protein RadC
MNYQTYVFHEPEVKYIRREVPAIKIETAEDAYNHLRGFFDNILEKNKEHVVFVGLNSKNMVKITKIISMGTDRQCLVAPREILKEALVFECSSFLLSHNHPSGDPSPSAADCNITRSIKQAAQIMDIVFHDHIIMGEPTNDPLGLGYYSFRGAGYI